MTASFPATRRAFVAGAVGTALSATIAAPMIGRGAYAFAAAPARSYSKRAVDLVAASLVIDMLAPLKITMAPDYIAHRLSDAEAAELGWQGFVGRNGHVFSLVDTVDDLDSAKAMRKCAVIMGIQNADQFDSVEDVAVFRRLGLRCAQLTYNSQNRIGSGSTDRVDGGVSDYGAAIIDAMEQAKMLIDVSHCGDRTTLDAIAIAKGPIAITHSNARALVDHPRVKTDEAIKALAAKGGTGDVGEPCAHLRFVSQEGRHPNRVRRRPQRL